jgi:hypothetical protein
MPLITLDGSGNGSTGYQPTIPGVRYIFSLATNLGPIGGTGVPSELTSLGNAVQFHADLSDPTPLTFDLTNVDGMRMEFVASSRQFLFGVAGGSPALEVEWNLNELARS